MIARVLRAVVVTLLAALALLVGAAPAFAHSRLSGSDPVDGASLDNGPERVSLTFNESLTPGFNTVTVVGPDGLRYESGDVALDGPTVSVDVAPLGPAGRYEIGYRVISADGHPVTGSVAFTLTSPGSGTGVAPPATGGPAAAAPALPGEAEGMPVWPWILGVLVLIGGGVFAALKLGR
jgi:methionine-rich copper-binding protein CopC